MDANAIPDKSFTAVVMVTEIVLAQGRLECGVKVTMLPLTCKVPVIKPEGAETRNDADVMV